MLTAWASLRNVVIAVSCPAVAVLVLVSMTRTARLRQRVNEAEAHERLALIQAEEHRTRAEEHRTHADEQRACADQQRAYAEEQRIHADKQQAIYSAVVERSDDAITSVRLDGTVVAWNGGAERLFGYPAAEVVRVMDGSFLFDGDEIARPDLIERLRGGERCVQFEAHAPRRDGSTVEVWVTVSPVFDGAGTLIGTARISRDLTARRQAQAERRAAEELAAQAQRMASLGQLAGGVAHDFNNLLGIVLNFIAFAAEEAGDNEGIVADLEKARVAAERAVGLTRQLLTFSRQDTVRPRLLDANASIAEARHLLARTIGAHLTLVVTPSPEPLMIFADDGRIQQVLVNLAVNARDAMPDGGTLVMETKAVDLDDAQDDVHPTPVAGRYARFLVGDTGTGMSQETLGRIFEPFFTTKPRGHGTGLGLATVYGIIVEAGGCVNVSSEMGIGTTFRVYFPIAATPDPSDAAAPETVDAPRGQGQTILVVEDERALGETIARVLTGAGYRVLSAEGGPRALELDAGDDCDLLLTDVIMPGMSGRQLAETWRRRHPDRPVLYMSGYTDGLLYPEQTPDLGLQVIEKPFTAHRLLTELHTALTAHLVSRDRR